MDNKELETTEQYIERLKQQNKELCEDLTILEERERIANKRIVDLERITLYQELKLLEYKKL